MYEQSFPRCTVQGSREPVPYKRGMMKGHIPEKCSTCRFLEGGMCSRGIRLTEQMLRLDHGPCSKEGVSDPEVINIPNTYPFEKTLVPWKCRSCAHLMADGQGGMYCKDQLDIWEGFPRGLDWGKFVPDHPVIGLKDWKLDREIIHLEAMGKRNQAIRVFRNLNPKASIKEGIKAMVELRTKLMMFASQNEPGGPYW